ncbi:DUF4422 domain-containing protein [Octadecabacter sp. G9-8]|uniref:DUF4422 domain-containing protein n=1 Tax=Octadecabacter dasysiphoniae TaxID=2909341 RepID=A0ABS9CXQ9_9RHOB|nr:DUF4422 domain-containing protein [Octadecabacter dasysiphoniae]MCF2870961.1 DUF4422 domain-containing protein [Octadecabacter dasysiphoniae]
MSTKIYVAYHTWAPRIVGGPFTPIHVGRGRADVALRGMMGDDTGDHISGGNDAWCELTALYWAWKNDSDSQRIGLMHYRRVLDLMEEGTAGQVETQVADFDVQDWTERADHWLARADFDVVVPRLHTMGRCVEENYKHTHAPQDWDVARDVIAAHFPEYLQAFAGVAAGRAIRLGNLAIMTRAVLDRYCAFVFGVLHQVERADVDRSYYSTYQSRYLGFLAERLLTVFIEHERQTNPTLKIKEVGILKLDHAMITPYLGHEDAPEKGAVNVAVSADRAYLPHAAAMVRSLLDHANSARPINLFFLHSGLDPGDVACLRDMVMRARRDVSFHPINTGTPFDKSYRSSSRGPSNTTYNRFLVFSLLPGLDRLLYLDADMIITRDICELYDTEMGDAQIGAVTDWIMTRTLAGPTRTADPEVPDLRAYHRETLGLTDAEIARYFNAGVLLINFVAMKDPVKIGQRLMKAARDGRYMFRDQDILNKMFKGSLHQLDARWNVFNSRDHAYAQVPRALWQRARVARADPWIVHFADRGSKPWNAGPVPMADLYWQALIRTPFYRDVVGAPMPRSRARASGRLVAWGRAVARRVPFLRTPLLRAYHVLGWADR